MVLATLVLSVPFAAAQEGPYVNARPLNCESGLVVQDFVVNGALEKSKDAGVLIVVVHSGDGERSRLLMQRRLFNVRQYFKNRGSRVPADKLVVSEGEKVPGLGRIDYYLDGKLYARLLFFKGRHICHSCCGPDEAYYPDKAIFDNKRRRKGKRTTHR